MRYVLFFLLAAPVFAAEHYPPGNCYAHGDEAVVKVITVDAVEYHYSHFFNSDYGYSNQIYPMTLRAFEIFYTEEVPCPEVEPYKEVESE